MRSGRLDRRIDIQRRAGDQSASGEPSEGVWTTLSARRPAAIWIPPQGQETFTDPQLIARERVEWLVRFSTAIEDLSPLDRIIYPALPADSPQPEPDERNIYDIVSVHEYGRREGLRIVTARRPDV